MEDPELTEEEKKQAKDSLSKKIKTILAENGHIKRVIIKWGLTEAESFMCESALINMLEFAKDKTIVSLTNIVNGHASEPEKRNSANVKTKARLVETFLQDCAIESRPIELINAYRVVLININTLYPLCLDNEGMADREKVKEVVRGLWRMRGINFRKACRVQYVFALYQQRVVGTFHVTRPPMSLAEEREHGFPDFPHFPDDIRRLDEYKSCAPTLAEAKALLPHDHYAELIKELRGADGDQDPERAFANFQRRIYFVLDDDVPEEIRKFENCLPTKNGNTDFIRKGVVQFGNPVFNF